MKRNSLKPQKIWKEFIFGLLFFKQQPRERTIKNKEKDKQPNLLKGRFILMHGKEQSCDEQAN